VPLCAGTGPLMAESTRALRDGKRHAWRRASGGRPAETCLDPAEEELRGLFRPAGADLTVKGGIAADGNLTAWEFHTSLRHVGDRPAVCGATRLREYHRFPLLLRIGS